MIKGIHHIAIICSNYEQSKDFYTRILGLEILSEIYRDERKSYKLDLALNGTYCIELFSFPNTPERLSNPEASGLRHIAFYVSNLENEINRLGAFQVECEEIRIDPYTSKRFTFLKDPDGLPIELYEEVNF